MRILIQIAFLIAGFEAFAAAPVACTINALMEAHRSEMGTATFNNPGGVGYYSNPYAIEDASLPDYQGPMVRTDAETIAAFNEVRGAMIADISRGASEASLSHDQRLMINRLRNLKVVMSNEGDTASNSMEGHYITLYRMTKAVPRSALVAMIGHELGHSLDLCNLPKPMLRADFSLNIDWARLTESGEAPDLAEIRRAQGRYLVFANTEPQNRTYLNQLLNRQMLQLEDSGVPTERNPTLPVFQCLKTQGYSSEILNDQQECSASEDSAQIWGARALANYVRGRQISFDEAFATAMALSMKVIKRDRDGTVFAGNPSGKERDFNQIYLSQPEVQRALGCTPEPSQTCMSKFNLDGPVNAPVQGTQATH